MFELVTPLRPFSCMHLNRLAFLHSDSKQLTDCNLFIKANQVNPVGTSPVITVVPLFLCLLAKALAWEWRMLLCPAPFLQIYSRCEAGIRHTAKESQRGARTVRGCAAVRRGARTPLPGGVAANLGGRYVGCGKGNICHFTAD